MERVILEHDIKTEYKKIRETSITYVTVGGKEKEWDKHKGSQIAPGSIIEGVYTATDVSGFSEDIQGLAASCWTPDIHTAYEVKLRQ